MLAFLLRIETFSGRLVITGVFAAAQIILSQLILCILGIFYLPLLIMLNCLISGSLIYIVIKKIDNIRSLYGQEAGFLIQGLRPILAWENIFLIILGIFVSWWLLMSAYYLPPRSVDGLTYHLPPVYEYILNHKIFL